MASQIANRYDGDDHDDGGGNIMEKSEREDRNLKRNNTSSQIGPRDVKKSRVSREKEEASKIGESKVDSSRVVGTGVFVAPVSIIDFLKCGHVSKEDTLPKPIDKAIMSFDGNAEWASAGVSVFPLASIVHVKRQVNMHPRDDLDPTFPNATILIMENIEDNHITYWLNPVRFPKVKKIFLHSCPPGGFYARHWVSRWADDVVFYYEEENVTLIPYYHNIKIMLDKFIADEFSRHLAKRFQVISQQEMANMTNGIQQLARLI